MNKLAIFGASGHGKVIADTASLSGMWQEIVFFDDACIDLVVDFPWSIQGGLKVLLEGLPEFAGVIVGIGNNSIRQQKQEELMQAGAKLVSIIHPQAYVSPYSRVGVGSVVFAQAAVNIDAKVGLGAIVNTGATIDHDCTIDDFTHVSPGGHLSGNVAVGARSWVGVGSSVRQGIMIGRDVVVAAGSVVVENVPDSITVLGVPAKPFFKTN